MRTKYITWLEWGYLCPGGGSYQMETATSHDLQQEKQQTKRVANHKDCKHSLQQKESNFFVLQFWGCVTCVIIASPQDVLIV